MTLSYLGSLLSQVLAYLLAGLSFLVDDIGPILLSVAGIILVVANHL